MNKPLVVVSGPVATRSGYGAHARDIVKSLIKMDKYDVKIISTRWGNTPLNALSYENEDHREIVSRIATSRIDRQPDVSIQITIPSEFRRIAKQNNIGITAGIETTVAPVDWIKGCNQMDLIITPSEFSTLALKQTQYQERRKDNQQFVKDHKLERPIEVLFEGSDTTVYRKTNDIDLMVSNTLNKIPEDFCFLFVGHWLDGALGQDRKDVGMLIKTFLTVFKNNPNPPALVLKTSQATFSVMDRMEIMRKVDAIKSSMSGDLPNIYLIHGDLSDEQMNTLYNHSKIKAMVSFTKGEGYGRPLQEFAFSGKPIIASNWSGHVDFLSDYGLLVGGKVDTVHKSAVNEWILPESKWFTVNYGEAAGIMDKLYKNYDEFLTESMAKCDDLSNRFSFDAMHNRFEEILDKYLKIQQPLTLPKLTLPKLTKV